MIGENRVRRTDFGERVRFLYRLAASPGERSISIRTRIADVFGPETRKEHRRSSDGGPVMNHITFGGLGAVQGARPSQRALAKQRTRENILAAATTLFRERGYEGATVRDIAAAAGMTTGAVFASFTDKSDLFAEIVAAEHEAVWLLMSSAAKTAKGGGAVEAMLEAAVRFHLADLPLFEATMRALWSHDLGQLIRKRLRRSSAKELIGEVLREAIACGDLAITVEPDMLARMLWGSYVAALRRAALGEFGVEAVTRIVRDQAGIILVGASRI
jgi:AcrR family transcriptional regulator